MRRPLQSVVCAVLAACAGEVEPATGAGGSGGASSTTGGQGFGGAGGDDSCVCEPGIHNDAILVLSDEAEIWAFDPALATFSLVRALPCAVTAPYSMAVDSAGMAWVLDVDSRDLFTVALDGSGGCGDPGYEPGPLQAGFSLFGMGFTARAPQDRCGDLYTFSYSGEGPFSEGADKGVLGKLDSAAMRLEIVGGVDFDGGELSGTGDGRLFAFAGVNPSKLVELDPETGDERARVPLDGLEKGSASAFALFGGSAYFFTEAQPADCGPCLEANCGAAYAACLADPMCAAALDCAVQAGHVTDACGGEMGAEMLACLGGPCTDTCLASPSNRVSRVTRLDLSASAPTLEVVVPEAPIRVVGAGTSICAPVVPR